MYFRLLQMPGAITHEWFETEFPFFAIKWKQNKEIDC